MHSFGASAPGETAFRNFGITVDAVVEAARRVLG
jgi:transketolase